LLQTVRQDFDDQKFDELLKSCKNDILSAIIGPFGLGGLIATADKNGGNVDTIHNAREGVYATTKEESFYKNKGDYNSSEYHGHKDYVAKNRHDSITQDQGALSDAYTGDKMSVKTKRDLDHTISAKEIHDDPGRTLAEVDGASLANTETNLHSTARAINRSKGKKTAEQFIAELETKELKRKERIRELSRKGSLSDKERKELKKLETLDKVDARKLKEIDEKARKEYNSKLNKEYYTSKKFAKNVAMTGTTEGAKMGAQQALGLVFCEFFSATFDELHDIYKNGFASRFEDERFIQVLKHRLTRIANRIAARWKDVCKAFAGGFISGFLSNLVTVVINMFIRTGKRIVRIIREGLFSILRAIKMLCFPPEGMTFAQAAHEASKLIAAGLAVAGGIALEQHIDNMIKAVPFIEPFADIITIVLVGGLTGLATTFIVYAIDKIDMFKVNDREKHAFVMERLQANLEQMFFKCEALVEEMSFCN